MLDFGGTGWDLSWTCGLKWDLGTKVGLVVGLADAGGPVFH